MQISMNLNKSTFSDKLQTIEFRARGAVEIYIVRNLSTSL